MNFFRRFKKDESRPSPEGKVVRLPKGKELMANEGSESRSSEGTEMRPSEGKEIRPTEGSERRQTEGSQIKGTATSSTYTATSRQAVAARIPSLSRGLRKSVVTQMPHECMSIWQSGDKLYLGECTQGSRITLVNMEGEVISTLLLGEQFNDILSGIEISETDRRHLVVAYDKQAGLYTLMEVTFNKELNTIKSNTVINVDYPDCIFSYSSTHVGVFCIHPTRFVLYKITDLSPSRSIMLDIPDVDPSSQCDVVKTEDVFYISESENGVVYVLDNTGELLRTLGQFADSDCMNVPGQLRYPYRIYLDPEGGLVIACVDGAYHRYLSGQWEVLVRGYDMGDCLWYCYGTVVGDKVYSVFKDRLTISKIRS